MIKYTQSGFTIVEIIIVIGILAILVGMGLPAYQNLVKNNCLTTTSTALVGALQYARAEAIKRREAVQVEKIDLVASTNLDWTEEGWEVMDVSTSTVVRRFEKIGCPQTKVWSNDPAESAFIFAPTGFVSAASNVQAFFVCDDRDNGEVVSPGREISISVTGRVRTKSKFTEFRSGPYDPSATPLHADILASCDPP